MHRLVTVLVVVLAAIAAQAEGAAAQAAAAQTAEDAGAGDVVPNDNRVAAGTLSDGVLELTLNARLAAWKPDLDVDSTVTVQAFAAGDGVARVPGPLLRAPSGTAVRLTVRNDIPDSTLVVYGLRAGTQENDTVIVLPGSTRTVRYTLGAPGTYLYWGTTSGKTAVGERNARDGQLTGAIVVDVPGVAVDPDERIFVMTVIDIVPDTTKPPPVEDIWELAINGRAWPYTERLRYDVGDTIRWRWLNGSYLPHPMHLHGFHFRVLAKGTGVQDRTFSAGEVRHVVTEFMRPGSTFAMEWMPTRAGNWLFHCHMAPHISPYPARPDSVRAHDEHDVAQHALYGMAGLVLGIETVARAPERISATADEPASERTSATAGAVAPARHLRLYAQRRVQEGGPAYGYVLQEGDVPAPDSVVVPGPPLLLTRGETTAITVVNRTDGHTTVHWHGMELESIYDGVAGWSGSSSSLAPLILPGDSFTVAFTPPRAGTYIYHTHMDESLQLGSGMYGPMLVLEPGEQFDPARELLVVVGRAVDGAPSTQTINGRREPPVRTVTAGTTYRLRLISILPAAPVVAELLQDSVTLTWRPVSKDGAALPEQLRQIGPARINGLGVGETYDMEWTPERPGDVILQFTQPLEGWTRRMVFRVTG